MTWIDGALDDRDASPRWSTGADAVIHVAGVINAPDAAGFEAGNVAGTAAMLAAAEQAGRPALRPCLLARRARAAPVALWREQGTVRGAGRAAPASPSRSSARRRSTAPATGKRSSCSAWPSAGCPAAAQGPAVADPCRRPGPAAARARRAGCAERLIDRARRWPRRRLDPRRVRPSARRRRRANG